MYWISYVISAVKQNIQVQFFNLLLDIRDIRNFVGKCSTDTETRYVRNRNLIP